MNVLTPINVKNNRLSYLLDKYLNGSLNEQEKNELDHLYRSASNGNEPFPEKKKVVKARLLERINKEIQFEKKEKSFSAWTVAASVAIFLCCIGIGIYHTKGPKPFNTSAKILLIKPGKHLAILKLSNGKTIYLKSNVMGRLAVQGNSFITKNDSGKIVYNIAPGFNRAVEYNTLSTPLGGQFQVVLSDGTRVWLNAGSSIKYPSRFVGSQRHVELEGEAYFEVYKDKTAPFTVTANQVNIKVLGTHFNVMAYNNEPTVKTTLLEGSVSLNVNNLHKLLKPGQQAVATKNTERIVLSDVNVEDAIAWKNGYFSFRKENLKSAMDKIARWYNVSIEYRGNADNKALGGTISRAQDIRKLLDYLELTGIAKFKIEERRIIVICK